MLPLGRRVPTRCLQRSRETGLFWTIGGSSPLRLAQKRAAVQKKTSFLPPLTSTYMESHAVGMSRRSSNGGLSQCGTILTKN
jgi:hypothetical protein